MELVQALRACLACDKTLFPDLSPTVLYLLNASVSTAMPELHPLVVSVLMRYTEIPFSKELTALFTLPLLMDLAFVLGSSYRRPLRQLFQHLQVERTPSLKQDCRDALELWVDTINRAQRRYEKGGHDLKSEKRELFFVVQDAVRTWSSLMALWPDNSIAKLCLFEQEEFIKTVQHLYDGLFGFLLPNPEKSLKLKESSTEAVTDELSMQEFKLLKVEILTLLYRAIDAVFHLDKLRTKPTVEGLQSLDGMKRSLVRLLKTILDQTRKRKSAEASLTALENAPFLSDLDAVFDLHSLLVRIPSPSSDLCACLDMLQQWQQTIDQALVHAVFGRTGSGPKSKSGASTPHHQAPPQLQAASYEDDLQWAERSSIISQVQELFPELGDGFIDACLLHYNDKPEAVIAALCDSRLPVELEQLDRQMKRLKRTVALAPQLTMTEEGTRNENADMDSLHSSMQDLTMTDQKVVAKDNISGANSSEPKHTDSLDPPEVHRGKKNRLKEVWGGNNDEIKARIIQSYANMYEDEYDDSYDDYTSMLAPPQEPGDPLDDVDNVALFHSLLVKTYASTPAVFDRKARRTPAREELLKKTQLTDEQIEGWRVMFEKRSDKDDIIRDETLFKAPMNVSLDAPKQNTWVFDNQPTRGSARSGRRGTGRGRGTSQRRRQGHDRKQAKGMGFLGPGE